MSPVEGVESRPVGKCGYIPTLNLLDYGPFAASFHLIGIERL